MNSTLKRFNTIPFYTDQTPKHPTSHSRKTLIESHKLKTGKQYQIEKKADVSN